jgi:hypothetical protein
LRLVGDLVDFVRGHGFVLNFSDASFSEFLVSELMVNIDDPTYTEHGGSKGKRPHCYLQKCDEAMAVRALSALWERRAVETGAPFVRVRDLFPYCPEEECGTV